MDLKGKGRAVEVDDAPDDIADSHATTSEQPYLVGLNKAQREAVTWSRKGGLQILAGPGSGESTVHQATFRNPSAVVDKLAFLDFQERQEY